MNSRFLIASLALVIGLLLGWLLIGTPPDEQAVETETKIAKNTIDPVAPDPQSGRDRSQSSKRDLNFDPNAIPYERIIAFTNEEDYRRFLEKLGNSKLRNLGQIDALFAVRLGFDKLADFDDLEIDPDQLEFNYPVTIPEDRQVAPENGLVGFGASALAFLGITTDNSEWGSGVKIAIIDTGIEPHLALGGKITHINLIDLEAGVTPNSHGTSVASLIAGTHPNMKGVAPGADLIDVRIADQNGVTSSFLLAEGILAATDAGADFITIAMGSEGDSALVRRAIDYATAQGVVIFASSGNDGDSYAAQPAANPKVYSVGAVDAIGQTPNFSSRDEDLSLSAPGYQIRAAVLDDNVTSFTGTSASVAFPVGGAAAIMSVKNVSAQVATDLMLTRTNEAGAPGADSQYGNGILDVGRVINSDTPGIVDLAVASQGYYSDPSSNKAGLFQVNVENRGTEPVYQSSLAVTIAGDLYNVGIQSLQPNERTVIEIPAGYGVLQRDGQLSVQSAVNLSGNVQDAKPSNDQRDEIILLPDNGS